MCHRIVSNHVLVVNCNRRIVIDEKSPKRKHFIVVKKPIKFHLRSTTHDVLPTSLPALLAPSAREVRTESLRIFSQKEEMLG